VSGGWIVHSLVVLAPLQRRILRRPRGWNQDWKRRWKRLHGGC